MYQPPDPSGVGRCLRCSSCIEESEQIGGICYDCQPIAQGEQPAFPVQASDYGGHGTCFGLTIRDYFAAKAMQALLTRMNSGPGNPAAAERMTRESAEYAYATADAMLTARVKP
ncbi:hypothetical protein N5D53_02280 [Pseudomonas sp. GD03862]|uniref:hypothetical protein n=1 Tax=Pseudomonas sp. GD03862 TaxID=2975391 RepID=UPI00244B68C0|nr:hypothetical protein [Pseudomonas sp. GD03862]MDH0705355.1 hypothetical protein [Pseudomonas sp. GD03862]